MVEIKTEEEIEIMKEGGRKLRRVLDAVLAAVQPGISKLELDKIAEKEMQNQGGEPGFKRVPRYHWSTCLTVNNEVVHGIPNQTVLKSGDVLGIDLGLYFRGFNTDLATTVIVGNSDNEKDKFLTAGKEALESAIKQAKPGNHVGDISLAIQEKIKSAGYSPVKGLTGHGVGRELHEDPSIPCFLDKEVKKTPELKKGMTLAIEVIYNQGTPELVLTDDGWTIVTKDGKISSLFEETVAVIGSGPLILTR